MSFMLSHFPCQSPSDPGTPLGLLMSLPACPGPSTIPPPQHREALSLHCCSRALLAMATAAPGLSTAPQPSPGLAGPRKVPEDGAEVPGWPQQDRLGSEAQPGCPGGPLLVLFPGPGSFQLPRPGQSVVQYKFSLVQSFIT